MDIVMEENQGYSSNDDSDYIENDKIDNRKKDNIQHNNHSKYIKRKDKVDINNISNNMDQQQIYLLQDINYLNKKIYHQKSLSSNLSHIKDSFGESDIVWKEDIVCYDKYKENKIFYMRDCEGGKTYTSTISHKNKQKMYGIKQKFYKMMDHKIDNIIRGT